MARKIDTDAVIGKIRVQEQGSDPSAPATAFGYFYEKTDQQVYFLNASGTATNLYHYGTSFPGSPKTHELFYRTDRNLEYFYDGTRWLTTQEYSQVLGNLDNNQPFTVNASLAWGATDLGANGQWITRISAVNYVSTTNNGTSYWTVQLTSRTAGAVAHNIGSSWNTSAISANSFEKFTTTVGAQVTAGDTHFVVSGTKTSTPGSIYTMATIYYRLIG